MPGHVPSAPLPCDHRVPRAPLPAGGVTTGQEDLKGPLGGRCPSFIAHTSPCAKPKPSPRLGFRLAREVLAGCYQPLLGDGPSRHYLCDPCAGARTHTPPRSSAALVHSFTEDTGLTPRETGSAHGFTPASQLQRGAVFRGCSHSITFGLLHSLGPQTAPTAASLPSRRALHTTHRPTGYPGQDVASLHVRHGQLTWLDSHQQGRSLVGCSLPHTAHRRSSPLAFGYPRHARFGRGATTIPLRSIRPSRSGDWKARTDQP